MKIILNGTQKAKDNVEKELDVLQKKASARCILYSDILERLSYVEKRVDISKKNLTGTKVHFTHAQKFPNAYKYTPESTHFIAEFNGRNWVITNMYRDICPNRMCNLDVELSDSAKEAVLESYKRF